MEEMATNWVWEAWEMAWAAFVVLFLVVDHVQWGYRIVQDHGYPFVLVAGTTGTMHYVLTMTVLDP